MNESARIHKEATVVICHEDVPIDIANRRLRGEDHVMAEIHLPRYREGGVNLVVMAVGGDQIRPYCNPRTGFQTYMEGALLGTSQMYEEERESEGGFIIVTEPSLLDEVSAPGGPVGVTLHLEGSKPLQGRLSMLEIFHRLGVRSLQLAWQARNEAADSIAEPRPGGLSPFGKAMVRRMNDLGMIIDLSHLAPPCVEDVLELTRHPVMASHSNARALHDHPRNLTDEQIKGIAATGGLVGVVFFPLFLGSSPTIERILDHFDYVRDLVGVDHLCVGPDFVDYAPGLILGEAKARGVVASAEFPQDAEDVTKMPNLTAGLLRRGYAEEDIRKILGGNFLRIARQVWGDSILSPS